MGVNGVNSNQINTLLDSMEKNKTEKKEKEKEIGFTENTLKNKVKGDFLDLSSQIEIISKQNSKITDRYTELEEKIGIDSKNWGVEAVSDNIVNFAKNLYERYKLEHEGEDLQEGLETFYNMAKNSIQAGYDEAMNYLGVLPDDVQELSKATLDRSLEKLDTWYQNGGKDVESTEDNTVDELEEQDTVEELSTEEKKTILDNAVNVWLEESETIKTQVLELLKEQRVEAEKKEDTEDKTAKKIDISV